MGQKALTYWPRAEPTRRESSPRIIAPLIQLASVVTGIAWLGVEFQGKQVGVWGLMHRNVTHNQCYATCAQFADAALGFLRETVPRNWPTSGIRSPIIFAHQPKGFSGYEVKRGITHLGAFGVSLARNP